MLEYNKIVAVIRGKATGSTPALQNHSNGQEMKIENCPKSIRPYSRATISIITS
jgi:hypothetical protein